MCVICHAAKKRYMKRAEVVQAMKANNAGFFGFTVHDGDRRLIRTLDAQQLLKFFDGVDDDDVWVMHARIPSRGEKTLDNVHGWEQDGILFCHNMTLAQLDDMMRNAKWEKTDSEFFFRHVFIPFYRGCGPDAYKDGKFCDDLDNLVRHFCGHSNKFLFIMPDNTVVRYGDWVSEADRKTEDGECAFYASNSSYKVYEAKWPARSETRSHYGFGCYGGYGYDDYDDCYDGNGFGCDESSPGARCSPTKPGTGKTDVAALVRGVCGDRRLCQMALCDIAAHGAVAYRALPGDWATDAHEEDDVERALLDLLPYCYTDDSYEAAKLGLEALDRGSFDEDGRPFTVPDFVSLYVDKIAADIVKEGVGSNIVPLYPNQQHVRLGLDRLGRKWRAFARIAGLDVDFSAKGVASFACLADNPERDGNRWKTNKVRAEDLLVNADQLPESVYAGIGKVLQFIQADGSRQASVAEAEEAKAKAEAGK